MPGSREMSKTEVGVLTGSGCLFPRGGYVMEGRGYKHSNYLPKPTSFTFTWSFNMTPPINHYWWLVCFNEHKTNESP